MNPKRKIAVRWLVLADVFAFLIAFRLFVKAMKAHAVGGIGWGWPWVGFLATIVALVYGMTLAVRSYRARDPMQGGSGAEQVAD
jgi:hypothetical protein